MLDTAKTRWHPIAAADDLPFRHVFHAQLLGREFAVWRADDNYINVWENRCLHRGVRLSIGINDGRELKCQYHGWRYSNRTSGCTYIPAHPADAPARTICNRTFASVERYGLIWSAEEPEGDGPACRDLSESALLVLRGLPVNAPADKIAVLLKEYRFQPAGALGGDSASVTIENADDYSVILRAAEGAMATRVAFFVQPVDSNRSIIRGVLEGGDRVAADRVALLRHHNERLSKLRDAAERDAAARPSPAALQPAFQRVSAELAEMPELTASGRKATIRVRVARKWVTATGIAAFELQPLTGILPTFQPGAHIDVHMPNGLIRQYSLTNAPGETDSFVIGVKLDSGSRGGSRCMHETVREGDILAISEPRNNFPLRRDATKTLFVAGGIGITPLLAMAQVLENQKLPFELHYFAQDPSHLAFPERTKRLGSAVRPQLGLSPKGTAEALGTILTGYQPGMHLYVCGPGPMLEATRSIAAEGGWPDDAVHFEYFKNTNKIDDSSSFEVALARSAVTFQVPSGKTILQAMREAGVDMPSSCEQGACGTCLATVLEGEPDHQDVYLTDAEKRDGNRIMTCVSRARSARLVLDL